MACLLACPALATGLSPGAWLLASLRQAPMAQPLRVSPLPGTRLVVAHMDGRPPVGFRMPVAVVPSGVRPQGVYPQAYNALSGVPAFDWCYGCVPTATAMVMGYYDRLGYANLYAGPSLVDRELWGRREQDPAAIEAELAGPKGRGWLMRWLPSRAHDNGMFLVFANGIGIDDDEIRTGNSMVLDCYGRILSETGKAGDALVVADLDASLLERCTGRRWIKSRRPELYGPLAVPTGLEQDTRSLKMAKDGI